MWHFHVTFTAPWSCQKVIHRRLEYKEDGKTKYEYWDDYSPANGTVADNFNMLISGSTENRIIHDFTRHLPYETFSPELIDKDATILENDITRDSAWNNKKIARLVEDKAQRLVKQSLPSSYTDLNYYYEYNYNQGTCILYSMYVATFEYEGKTYENHICGWDDFIEGNVDAPRQKLLDYSDDHDLIEPNTSASMWAWGLIFLILGGITAFVAGAHNHTPSLISAIAPQ